MSSQILLLAVWQDWHCQNVCKSSHCESVVIPMTKLRVSIPAPIIFSALPGHSFWGVGVIQAPKCQTCFSQLRHYFLGESAFYFSRFGDTFLQSQSNSTTPIWPSAASGVHLSLYWSMGAIIVIIPTKHQTLSFARRWYCVTLRRLLLPLLHSKPRPSCVSLHCLRWPSIWSELSLFRLLHWFKTVWSRIKFPLVNAFAMKKIERLLYHFRDGK